MSDLALAVRTTDAEPERQRVDEPEAERGPGDLSRAAGAVGLASSRQPPPDTNRQSLLAGRLLGLQRTVGNRATTILVQRLVAGSSTGSAPPGPSGRLGLDG